MNYTIAIAQVDSIVGDLEANVVHHVEFVKDAIARKADVVVFPELSLTGYTVRDLNWDLAVNLVSPAVFNPLLALSKRITIIAGGIEEGDNFALYNAAFVFENGRITSAHRKIYPPTYGMFEELRYFSPGNAVQSYESRHGKIGVLVCEDLWHLSLPYILAHDGANIIAALAASPTRVAGGQEELQNARVNLEHHKTYARLLSTYLVFANRVGIEDGVTFWGGSGVIAPSGEVVCSAKLFAEDLIVAPIDENEVRRARRLSRHFVDDSPAFTIEQLTNALRRNS
jgi:predicted amidohydrolase